MFRILGSFAVEEEVNKFLSLYLCKLFTITKQQTGQTNIIFHMAMMSENINIFSFKKNQKTSKPKPTTILFASEER